MTFEEYIEEASETKLQQILCEHEREIEVVDLTFNKETITMDKVGTSRCCFYCGKVFLKNLIH